MTDVCQTFERQTFVDTFYMFLNKDMAAPSKKWMFARGATSVHVEIKSIDGKKMLLFVVLIRFSLQLQLQLQVG